MKHLAEPEEIKKRLINSLRQDASGRMFSHNDNHDHRLGDNFHLLPVNAPRARS
jgi:catalase